MTELDRPLELPCGTVLANRLVKAAMSEQLADRHGRPTAQLSRLYSRWAYSGAAVLITGNVMVDASAVSEPRQVVLDDHACIRSMRQWSDAATANNAHAWVQLNHAGQQVPKILQHRPLAPSSVKVAGPPGTFGRPRAMTGAQINQIPEAFARAAGWAIASGFTGVQIHAAHGYLLSQFLSPQTNQRCDAWGGSPRRRRRLLQLVVAEVRQAVGVGIPLSVKVNSSDFRRGGASLDEVLETVEWLGENVDVLEVSGGTFESAAMVGIGSARDHREAYFIDFAHAARDRSRAPLMLTGGFRTPAAMRTALREGACDLIGLARPFVHDPDAASAILHGRPDVFSGPKPPLSPAGRDPIVAAMAEIGWYTRQIKKIAAGREGRTAAEGLRGLAAYAGGQVVQAVQLRTTRRFR